MAVRVLRELGASGGAWGGVDARCGPMVQPWAQPRKRAKSHFILNRVHAALASGAGVKCVTRWLRTVSLPRWGRETLKKPQPWMNCICVPASSITSPFFRCAVSPTTGLPFTAGWCAPSTCAST